MVPMTTTIITTSAELAKLLPRTVLRDSQQNLWEIGYTLIAGEVIAKADRTEMYSIHSDNVFELHGPLRVVGSSRGLSLSPTTTASRTWTGVLSPLQAPGVAERGVSDEQAAIGRDDTPVRTVLPGRIRRPRPRRRGSDCGTESVAVSSGDGPGRGSGDLRAVDDPAQGGLMTYHSITWTLGPYGKLTGNAICTAPEGADCRLVGDRDHCQCEEWGELYRDADGRPYHLGPFGTSWPSEDRHYMHDQGECNIILFLNDSDIEECLNIREAVIGTTPINPVWDGSSYLWEPAT